MWGSEFENNVSKKNKRQNINLNQLKLKVNDAYKKDEETTTKFEPSSDEDVINKAYLDTKISKLEPQISYIQKDCNEFKLHNKKEVEEEVIIEKAAI